jgi:hypothetical protein
MTFRKISSGDVIIRSSLIEVYDVLNREQFSTSKLCDFISAVPMNLMRPINTLRWCGHEYSVKL